MTPNMASDDGKTIIKNMLDAVAASCLTVSLWRAMGSWFTPISIVLQPPEVALSIFVCLDLYFCLTIRHSSPTVSDLVQLTQVQLFSFDKRGFKQKGDPCHPGAGHPGHRRGLRGACRGRPSHLGAGSHRGVGRPGPADVCINYPSQANLRSKHICIYRISNNLV